MTEMLKIGDFVEHSVADLLPVVPAVPEAWFLIRVHPMRERKVMDALLRRGASCAVPTFEHVQKVHHKWRQWTLQKVRRVRSPIFPGIVFVPDFDADIRRLQSLSDGIFGYLRLGERAISLCPSLFDQVRRLELAMNQPLSQAKRALKAGDRVRIKEGAGNPFEMWTGRFQRLDGKGRLRVLIQIMEREVPVVLAEDEIEPVL